MAVDNSLYVLMGRQGALMKKVEVLSNNTANSNTPGFKRQEVIFEQVLHKATNKDIIHYSRDVSTIRKLEAGEYKATGNTFDIALVGQGHYFRINTPFGERYTRAGNFTLNAIGEIVTPQGYQLLNDGGEPIILGDGDQDFIVREDGQLTIGEDVIGQIGIAYFENEQFLKPIGNTMLEALVPPGEAANYRVYQGVIELSNVDNVVEMVNLIDAQRTVSITTNIINALDEMEKSAMKTFSKTM